MAELYGTCQLCGNRLILGESSRIMVETPGGEEISASELPEVIAGLRQWIAQQPCPSCGGLLRLPEEA